MEPEIVCNVSVGVEDPKLEVLELSVDECEFGEGRFIFYIKAKEIYFSCDSEMLGLAMKPLGYSLKKK
jgi:hypothetical protein